MTKRNPGMVVVALGFVLTLTGCVVAHPQASTPPKQRTSDEAVADLTRVAGVTNADVGTGTTGTPWQVELDVGADLDASFTGDLEALFDYTLAQAWSVTTKKPTTSVSIALSRDGKPVDIVPLAHALGWTYVTEKARNIGLSDMAKRYGKWPGPVPKLPASLGQPTP